MLSLLKAGLWSGVLGLVVGAVSVSATTPTYTTNYVWDADRQLTLSIQPDPGTGVRAAVRNTYDLNDLLTQTDKGTTTTATGSDFSALETTTYLYDYADRRIRTTTPAGVTQYAYDADGRATCTAVRLNSAVFGSLPADACTLSTAGALGPDQISRNVYDAASQVLQERRGVGSPLEQAYVTRTYGLDGELATIKDANNNLTTQLYDGYLRLATVQYPSTTLSAGTSNASDYESYTYDANDNRRIIRRRDGATITSDFDAINREISKVYSATTPTMQGVYTTYDLTGRPLLVAYGGATGTGVAYSYDTAGRMKTEATFGKTLTYGYDAAGNLASLTWPDGLVVNYASNAMNLVQTVIESGVTTLASFGYDNLGRPTSLSRGNGTSTGYGFDTADRLTSLTQTYPSSTTNNVTYGFGYTPASQVNSRTLSNAAYAWPGSQAQAQTKAYDGLNRDGAIAAATGYDGRGNLIYDGTRRFAYDIENRLISETTPVSATLSYDPLGRLSSTLINSTTTQFLYAGSNLVAEYDAGNVLLRRYVHGAGTDVPLVWYEGSGVADRRWLHQDRQGSVVAWSNGTGILQATYTYGLLICAEK